MPSAFIRHRCARHLSAFMILLGLPLAVRAEPPRRGDAVVLELVDGRFARGKLASAPDADRLVLSTATPGIELRSSFVREKVLAIRSLSEHDARLKTIHWPPLDASPPPPGIPAEPERAAESPPPEPAGSISAPAIDSASRWARIRSLAIEARVANWDGDPEADGLLVRVEPLDAAGRGVPVRRGWLSFDLHVQQFHTPRLLPWRRRDRLFFASDRWSVPVSYRDFDRYGTEVRLPFRRLHPEIDLDVAADALLRARLVVPGHGTFEASDANVRLRPSSRFRDELEQYTGRRFLLEERVGRWPSSPSSRLRSQP